MHHKHRLSGRTIDAPNLLEEYRQRELSRRQLLERALAGSAAMVVASCSGDAEPTVVADAGTAPADAGRTPDAGVVVDAGPSGPLGHLVGMGWSEDDYFAALDHAFAESTDLSFISAGDTVYFKVNCNNFDLYPHSTRPELIVELARRCRDHGATRIIVGDRSFWGDPNTARNMAQNGVTDAAAEAGAELLIFDDNAVDWVAVTEADAPNWAGGLQLPVPVMEANHIINLPIIKTHFISTFTMALKNVLGLVNPLDRRRPGNLDVHRKPRLWSQISQVNKFITPSLNILDGYEALITGGPTATDGAGASYAAPKVMIVSTDRIAADVTGIAVLQTLSPTSEAVTQWKPWRNPQIVQAAADGLGITGPEQYDLSGPSVPTIDTYRALATLV